jgi:integrase
MQTNETQSKASATGNGHKHTFFPARDARNRKVRGLWERNGRFYAALWVDRGDGRKTARRFPLEARTLSEAKEAMEVLRNDRREDKLPTQGRKPLLSAAIAEYLASPTREARRANTQEKDERALRKFLAHAGDVRIDRITPALIVGFQEARLREGVTARTVNLDLISLRGVLKYSMKKGHLRAVPVIEDLKREQRPKRALITPAQFEQLVALAVSECPRNGTQFADYLRLLAYSGAREQEALRLKWEDVNIEAGILTIGADGLAKNGTCRRIEFNPQLRDLLLDMASRREPGTPWVFPSFRRDRGAERTLTFRSSLNLIREKAGMPWIGFHDFRHLFASTCVMAGVDLMTIAAWMGHLDGGILVGKVYGHLLDEHKRTAAAKLSFGLRAMPSPEPQKSFAA